MHKKFNAYMTVEGSFLFSMILGLYYLMIILSLILFAKCINSQRDYLKAFYEIRFTMNSEENHGVIYAEADGGEYINENGMVHIDPLSSIYGK